MPELSIAMPFYNEGRSVLRTVNDLVKELKKSNIDYEIILVNNGSKDDTDKYINMLTSKNKRLKKVLIKKNQGYGWGIIKGLNKCTGKYVGYIDGDGQIRPKDVVSCLKFLQKNKEFALCKGKRKEKHGTKQRKIVSYIFDILFTVLFLRYIKDINAKPKIMKKEILKKLDLQSKGWFIDAEILIKFIKYGLKIGEVYVEVLPRKEGKSAVKPSIIKEFLISLAKARLGIFKH